MLIPPGPLSIEYKSYLCTAFLFFLYILGKVILEYINVRINITVVQNAPVHLSLSIPRFSVFKVYVLPSKLNRKLLCSFFMKSGNKSDINHWRMCEYIVLFAVFMKTNRAGKSGFNLPMSKKK